MPNEIPKWICNESHSRTENEPPQKDLVIEAREATPVIDNEALAEIEARTNAATDGPWQRGGNYWDQNTVTADAGQYFIADCHKNPMSAEFIAHAREDIPALCQTVRALQDELKVADDALETQVKWIGELRKENAALRDQLAEAQSENERLASQLREWQEEKDTKAGYL